MVEHASFHHGSPLAARGPQGSKKQSERVEIIVIIEEAAEWREGISIIIGSGMFTKAASHAGHWRSSMCHGTEGREGGGVVWANGMVMLRPV